MVYMVCVCKVCECVCVCECNGTKSSKALAQTQYMIWCNKSKHLRNSCGQGTCLTISLTAQPPVWIKVFVYTCT